MPASIFLGPNSLEKYDSDYLVMSTTMLMIVLGGIGYLVWFNVRDCVIDAFKKKRNVRGYITHIKQLNEHTKLVIIMTAILIFGGALWILYMEYNNPATIGNMSLGDKIFNSVFQSVTARTAGFSTFPQKGLRESTTLLMDVLMFIGGSPVGTAGGVKTVAVFIMFWNFISFIIGREEVVVFNKRISRAQKRKAAAIFIINLLLITFTVIIISDIDNLDMTDCLYEVFSTVSTVGLSRDLTDKLSNMSRVIIIIDMFLGRIGPITMALFFGKYMPKNLHVSYGAGEFYIG